MDVNVSNVFVDWKEHGLPVQIHDYYIMIYLASYYVENYVVIVINNLHEIIYLNINIVLLLWIIMTYIPNTSSKLVKL